MLLITDDHLIAYSEANEKLKINELINVKRFTVSNTPLTYRQVNSLGSDNLIPDDRKKDAGWRKFSIKELVYILVVHELKKFGLKHNQLKFLWEAFFQERKDSDITEINANKGYADVAIGLVILGIEINLAIDSEGNISIYDPANAVFLNTYTSNKPRLIIGINDIYNQIIEKTGNKPAPIKYSIRDLFIKVNDPLTLKEKEIIKIIRDNDYSSVQIRKKNGEIALLSAERYRNETGNLTQHDVLKLLDSKDFQDINIIKRNGKIVLLKADESIKL